MKTAQLSDKYSVHLQLYTIYRSCLILNVKQISEVLLDIAAFDGNQLNDAGFD